MAGAASLGVGAASATGDNTPAEALSGGGWPTARAVASVAEAERLAAGASSSARQAGAPAGQTLIVRARTLRDAEIDIPPAGFGPGDFFVFEERVFNRAGTRTIGQDSGRCELAIRTFTCEATLLVNGKGKIRVAGTFFSDNDVVVPVTGGTGAYQGVGGELSVFDLAGGDSLLVFHLVR